MIATDAWHPQLNGVVRTLENVVRVLEKRGHEVIILSHQWEGLKTFGAPGYPEVELVWNVWKIDNIIKEVKPDAIHVATEGPIGLATRNFCYWHKVPITSSYHTKTPEFLLKVWHIPLGIGYAFMRWLHRDSRTVLVTTKSMMEELDSWTLHSNMKVWTRGADLDLFNPNLAGEKRYNKTMLYVGRVSVEKNLEAFFNLNGPEHFRKVVVGSGPMLEAYQQQYPDVIFVGAKTGIELAKWFADADVFVFPSKWDTFGVVMIEANACGTPIAGYPVTGPKDFVINGVNGWLDENLEIAVEKALTIDRKSCRTYVENNYSWEKCVDIFEQTLVPVTWRWQQLSKENC